MILPDVQPILRLDAFIGDARPHHLGEAVDVDRVHVEFVLDLAPHRVRPGLGAEDADLERGGARIDAGLAKLVEDGEHVGGRDHDDVGAKIVDELHLPLGHAARHRDHAAAELLGPRMRAEPAGEEPIAVGDVDEHAGPRARGPHRTRHERGPDVEIGFGVTDDGRLAGGAG